MMSVLLVLLLILGIFVPSSRAVTCYQCSSAATTGCGDPFSAASSSRTCSAKYCVKTKAEVEGNELVVRSCSPVAAWQGCKSTTHQGHSAVGCFCDSDRCNGTPPMTSFGHVFMAVVALVSVVVGYAL